LSHSFLNSPHSIEEILPSSWAAAEYLRSEHPGVTKAFVIGSQGLVDELALAGVASIGGADPAYATRVFRSEADFLEVRVCELALFRYLMRVWDVTVRRKKREGKGGLRGGLDAKKNGLTNAHRSVDRHDRPSPTQRWGRWCVGGT
jgi:hypothetical protein